ncbi:MAG: MFS transporter, partial [Clostridiales bacterium]|nr:MFS transporter [Clostridiales bacterium]
MMALTGLVSPVISLLSAELIRRGILTKKSVVLTGLFTLSATGLLALVLHYELWHLGLLSVLTGIASGCYLSTILSIMVDRFTPQERQTVTGIQSVFVNTGGFLISVLGGLLAAWRWYGGYIILLAGVPLGILAFLTLPKETRARRGDNKGATEKSKFETDIFFYAITVFLFMIFFSVINPNLAIHLASSGYKNPALAGVITAIQMAGGVVFGFIFPKLSRVLTDRLLYIAYFMLAAGLAMLSQFHSSVVLMAVGVFLAGASMSLIGPHCVVSSARLVDARTSALATSLITGLAPGLASFLSPVIITNLTTALGGESTVYRYRFVGLTVLICGLILVIIVAIRQKERLSRAVAEERA